MGTEHSGIGPLPTNVTSNNNPNEISLEVPLGPDGGPPNMAALQNLLSVLANAVGSGAPPPPSQAPAAAAQQSQGNKPPSDGVQPVYTLDDTQWVCRVRFLAHISHSVLYIYR